MDGSESEGVIGWDMKIKEGGSAGRVIDDDANCSRSGKYNTIQTPVAHN